MALQKVKDSMRTTTGLDAAKLTGTVASARMGSGTASSSTVLYGDGTYKAEPVTDTTSIKNDISLLALQNAINGNLSAYGLKNSWIEQFENSTFIENLSSVSRVASGEYVSSVSSGVNPFTSDSDTKFLIHMEDTALVDSGPSAITPTKMGTASRSSVQNKIGTYSVLLDGNSDYMKYGNWTPAVGTGDFTIEAWIWPVSPYSGNQHIAGTRTTGSASSYHWGIYMDGNRKITFGHSGAILGLFSTAVTGGAWNHVAVSRTGSAVKGYLNGVQDMSITASNDFSQVNEFWVGYSVVDGTYFNGYIDEVRASTVGRYTTAFTPNLIAENNATGSFTSTVVVPQDTVNKSSVGLVVLYKDNAGTNTLNTDIVAKVRANTGQAYQTLVLAGAGTYSDSLKIAIAPAIAVTAGQALSYEISFANQASGTKEARIYGVAMTY